MTDPALGPEDVEDDSDETSTDEQQEPEQSGEETPREGGPAR